MQLIGMQPGVRVNPTEALVLSQVVLSAALPFPMIALVYFTGGPISRAASPIAARRKSRR
jgi:Mn2+/Fe2+ NRAMP family transporter